MGETNTYSVYIHTAPNGKVYVGITGRTVSERWNCGNGYRANKHFWAAIRKYGWDNIKHEIVAKNLPKETAAEMEQELIKKYRANYPERGYNNSAGGESPSYGAKHTDEHKTYMSALLTGRKFSDETRRKMSESAKKRNPETRRRALSEETKRKISEATKGRPVSEKCKMLSSIKNSYDGNPSARKVDQYSANGTFIASFNCMKEAAEKTGCDSHHIGEVCGGKRKTCGGYVWRYAEAV